MGSLVSFSSSSIFLPFCSFFFPRLSHLLSAHKLPKDHHFSHDFQIKTAQNLIPCSPPFLGGPFKTNNKKSTTGQPLDLQMVFCSLLEKTSKRGNETKKCTKKIIRQTKITYLVQLPLLQQCVQLFIQSGLWPSKPSVILGNHTITV